MADVPARGRGKTPVEDLARIDPVLLTMLLGPRAVALIRLRVLFPPNTP